MNRNSWRLCTQSDEKWKKFIRACRGGKLLALASFVRQKKQELHSALSSGSLASSANAPLLQQGSTELYSDVSMVRVKGVFFAGPTSTRVPVLLRLGRVILWVWVVGLCRRRWPRGCT